MSLQCRDVREMLDSYIGQELLVETNHSVLRHLESCAECRAELAARTELRAGLKRAVLNLPELQPRLQFVGAVASHLQTLPAAAFEPSASRWADSRWMTRWLPLAASVLFAAGVGGYYVFGPQQAPLLARDAVGDHQNCAVQFRLTEKPVSLAEGASRFDPLFARLENLPPNEVRTDSGLLQVADRHVCLFNGHRFGHVVYKSGEHVVSVLVVASDPNEAPLGAADVTMLPDVDGLSVAEFSVPGHTAFVVSDLDETPFQQAARALQAPMRGLIAALRNILTSIGD